MVRFAGTHASDVRYRNYLIPAEALRADRENVVAVRIQANSTGERAGLISTRAGLVTESACSSE